MLVDATNRYLASGIGVQIDDQIDRTEISSHDA